MTITFAILFGVTLALLIFFALKNQRLEAEVNRVKGETQDAIAAAEKAAGDRVALVRQQAEAAVAQAQRVVDEQFTQFQRDADRVREYYEVEARKVQAEASAQAAEIIAQLEPLRRYQHVRDAEQQANEALSSAMNEASGLRTEAQSLLEQARNAASAERAQALQRAKSLREQADALLNQATKDSGRIMAEAEKRAEEIGGDAYRALREKDTLGRAAEALRNVVEGYGNKYLVPTHSLLDDLAAEFGYAAAGESLRSARDLSRRMVEQGEAAVCDYVEAVRKNTAVQFVIHAFNGRVDAILSRVKYDNYGILDQQIRDAFSLVNKDGQAFRNARILPAYLEARLAELKWAVIVQDLARQRQEEQRAIREEIRDRELAEKERKQKEQRAAEEEELKRKAVAEAEARFAKAAAEEKDQMQKQLEEARKQLEEATAQKLQISQQTKVGHVYVLSNIGSFGDGDPSGRRMYKIGETQREPEVRVKELGGASVPFEFDIHAVIETENSRGLEHKLHRIFARARVNKMNLRKEFFRITLSEIQAELKNLKQGVDYSRLTWTEEARAMQWKETRDIEGDARKLQEWEQNSARRRLGAEEEIA